VLHRLADHTHPVPDDVWSALAKGCLAFSHSHAGKITGSSFKDSGSLVSSLADGSPPGTTKARFEQLKKDIKDLKEDIKPLVKAIEKQAADAKVAVTNMATELGTSPFTWEAAARAATELSYFMIALDAATDIIATEIAKKEPNDKAKAQMGDAIRGIKEPWIAPFRSLGQGTTKGFDSLCKTLLGVDNAGKKFADQVGWSRAGKRLAFTLASAGPIGIPPLNFDGISVEAFFDYKTDAKVGIALRTNLRAGLRSDKLLEKIIPGEAPTANTNSIAVTLDTKDSLTFGEGPNRQITLPVRFSFPALELREMAIGRPVGKDENSGRIDLMVTIAAKFGDFLGLVAEGGGVIIRWKGEPNSALEVLPKPPIAAGLRIRTGIVNGGGYLRYKDLEKTGEYGGVLDLNFTKIGIWAEGLITPDPFSLVLVMGVHFMPKIELSYGFTLNGLGGIIALDRRLAEDELLKGIREGALNQILFPDDPIAAAPKILDRLEKIFPPLSGGFVVGPIAELGWGSQAGFVKAKIGVVLALPEPKIVVLGSLQVGVPSADIDPKLRIVDLRVEIVAEFTPDYVLIRGSLVNSKVAEYTISGDLGLLIRWNGGADFGLTIGGFFPKFTPPPELAGLSRLTLEISPPIPWLKVKAEIYFAITSNTVQFGGKVTLDADLEVAEAKAWIGVDALFQWSPRLYFVFLIDAGIEVKALGHTVAGVTFHGELSGMKPWHLEGHASVTILLWDVPVDIGPIEWGEHDESIAPPVSPANLAAEALALPAAWTPQLPAGADALARFAEDNTTPLLVHPLGALEVKQLRVPLETEIDRVGSSPVTSRRVHLVDPKVGPLDAAAVSHATDFFAPGHFINQTQDEQVARPSFEEFPCGMKIAASRGATFGAPISVAYAWDTFYPHESFLPTTEFLKLDSALTSLAVGTNATSRGMKERVNPYLPRVPGPAPAPFTVEPVGQVRVLRRDDLGAVAGAEKAMTTTAASNLLRELESVGHDSLQLVSAGAIL